MNYKNTEDYLSRMEKDLTLLSEDEFPELSDYYDRLKSDLKKALAGINDTNFWSVFPKILGIDSKLNLLKSSIEDIQLFNFSEEEVIQTIETDYKYFNREICGYDLRTQPHESIIFSVD